MKKTRSALALIIALSLGGLAQTSAQDQAKAYESETYMTLPDSKEFLGMSDRSVRVR